VRLKILDLSGNPIKSVPKHMGALEDLEELYVNFCSLETMDIHLAQCRKVNRTLSLGFSVFLRGRNYIVWHANVCKAIQVAVRVTQSCKSFIRLHTFQCRSLTAI